MALTFVTFPPSPTRPTHIATTPIGVDPSNEIQMLQSSCVKRHPGCYPVGGKTINEALRNVLKILWSVLKLPHGNICVGAPPICAWRPVARFLSLSISMGSYEEKILKTILTDYTCISQYPQYILLVKNNLNKISYHLRRSKMLSLTNEMVKKYNCLTFSKDDYSLNEMEYKKWSL